MTASLVACGAVVTLLPVVWPFLYVSSPVPEPFDCLEPEEPSTFKCSGPEDPRIVNHNFDTCWIKPPFTSHPLMGHGMPGLAPRWEDDDSFTTLFVLYVLAVAVSCAGAVVSSRMMLLLRRSGTYRATNYRRYLRALVFYFLMQTLVNFCAALSDEVLDMLPSSLARVEALGCERFSFRRLEQLGKELANAGAIGELEQKLAAARDDSAREAKALRTHHCVQRALSSFDVSFRVTTGAAFRQWMRAAHATAAAADARDAARAAAELEAQLSSERRDSAQEMRLVRSQSSLRRAVCIASDVRQKALAAAFRRLSLVAVAAAAAVKIPNCCGY